jgi:hypothetical protein
MLDTNSGVSRRPARLERADRSVWLVVLAVVLGVQFILGATASRSYQIAEANTADLVEIARGCVETDHCLGGGAGRLGVFNGAAWVQLLAHAVRRGADLTYVQSIIFGLLLLSAVVTFWTTAHYLGWRAAALGLGLYLPIVLAAGEFASLDNTNLFPLPTAVYYAALLLFVELRNTIFVIVASLALAAVASAYILFLVLVPFHFGLVALWARRPAFAVAASALSMALILFTFNSIGAAGTLGQRLLVVPATSGLLIGGAVVVLVLAVRVLPRVDVLTSLPTPVRVRVVMTAALIYSTGVVWLACGIFGLHLPPEARYLEPAIFPLLFLAAEATQKLERSGLIAFVALEIFAGVLLVFAPQAALMGRAPLVVIVTLCTLGMAAVTIIRRGVDAAVRSPAVAVILLCFALGVALPGIVPCRGACMGLALPPAERVVSSLYSARYTYPQLFHALHGPAADTLLALLAAHDPNLFGSPAYLADEDYSLLVMKVPRAAVARTRGLVVAFDVERPRAAIVVRGERSFLDWVNAEICRTTEVEQPRVPRCIKLLAGAQLFHIGFYLPVGDAAAASVDDRLYGETHYARPTWRWPVPPGTPYSEMRGPLRVAMPVHTPGRGVPHTVHAGGDAPDETWRIVRVSDVEVESLEPQGTFRLPDRQRADGVIEFEVAGVADEAPWNWLRHYVEVTEDNAHLLRLAQAIPTDGN